METPQHTSSLVALKNELIQFQSNDVLVNIHAKPHHWENVTTEEHLQQISVPMEDKWVKLYQRFQSIYKETGIQTACFVAQTITWIYNEKEIESPLLLIPLHVQRDKNTKQLIFTLNEEQLFVNPFIEKQFSELFDVSISLGNFEKFLEKIDKNPQVIRVNSTSIIGQFHYYRFLFLKELEEIETIAKNAVLRQLFAEEKIDEIQEIYTDKTILPKDPTQNKVLEQVGNSSFIIQGPPGTGKSQVLINILGKCFVKEGFFSVVSEKRAALEVIQKKLNQLNLANYCLFLDDQTSLKDTYQHLQNTWLFLESNNDTISSYFSVTDFKKQHFQLLLNRIQSENLSSGISYWELLDLHEKCNSNLTPDTYRSVSIEAWRREQQNIEKIATIPFEIWRFFDHSFWKTTQISDFSTWCEAWEKYRQLFPLTTNQEVIQLNQWCVIAQLHQTESYIRLVEISRFKTKIKQVEKLQKKYAQLQVAKENLAQKTNAWASIPSVHQIEQWEKESRSFFKKKRIQQLLETQTVSGIDFQTLREIALENEAIQQAFTLVRQDLIELGVFHPEQDFIDLQYLLQKQQAIHTDSWKTFEKLDERQLAYLQANLQDLLSFSRPKWLTFEKEISLEALIHLFKQSHPKLIENTTIIAALSPNLYYWMRKKNTWKEVEEQIILNEWTKFEQLFPELANTSLTELKTLVEEICILEQEDNVQFIAEIHRYRAAKLVNYHQLLLTKTTQLSAEEKVFRQQLKKGKSLLVKEFNKSRQHLPLRDLWNSDARAWLEVLCPIWLMTPTQVAKHFPMETDIFQLTLIDEASQIPASHILGTLQRSKQVVIAGDSQQMAPSNFFHAENQLDILSWGQYYFKNFHLRYHYRSQHPQLIQFSNRHFYNNELEVFPTANFTENPIEWRFVANGKYEEAHNSIEAKEVAEQIQKYITAENTIGIVAFSETQLQTIWKALDVKIQSLLQERIEEETAFFKSLDKVQGDECDVLIVSFGYGKDNDGNFKLHLGPIIKQGGEKRLNVLFSRAKQKIIFISSVQATDFPISDNESVQLLKQFFISLTQENHLQPIETPNFKSWLQTQKEADELLTKFRVYKERGWNI